MPLPMRTLVLNWNFAPVQLSDKFEAHWIGSYEVLDRICDVLTYSQDGSTFHTHRIHTIPYYSKKSLPYPHLQKSKRFSDSINFDTSKRLNLLIATHTLSIPMTPNQMTHPLPISRRFLII